MIVVDTSAVLALLLGEEENERFALLLAIEADVAMASPTFLEAKIVISARLGDEGLSRFEALLRETRMIIHPFDRPMAEIAADAYRRYGRGSAHPARLNFGDCFAYALARFLHAPLLFKGDDFSATDAQPALP